MLGEKCGIPMIDFLPPFTTDGEESDPRKVDVLAQECQKVPEYVDPSAGAFENGFQDPNCFFSCKRPNLDSRLERVCCFVSSGNIESCSPF
jgi:hypothetical protein